MLGMREKELLEKMDSLTNEAKMKVSKKDMSGAKRKILDRRRLVFSRPLKYMIEADPNPLNRCQQQLTRVNNSISIIESHSSAIEGTELNKSILDTLKASGEAIKRLNITGGIGTVEDIISEVETQMENASEITKVISAGQFPETLTHFGFLFNSPGKESSPETLNIFMGVLGVITNSFENRKYIRVDQQYGWGG